ncbi:MAG: hypothetical protein MJZ50_00300 [Treponema sp.]|nr:hypothetical protein [Treponema sp.]
MLYTLLYYVCFSSAVLVYGIGIERAIYLSKKRNDILIKAIKLFLTITSTSALSYLLVNSLFVPADLAELYPFVVILLFICLSVFIEIIIRISTKINAQEFGVSILFTFIAVSEGSSFAECVYISCLCGLSFFAVVPFIYSVCHRMDMTSYKQDYQKLNYTIVSIAIFAIILLAWNVSWLNKGVFQ